MTRLVHANSIEIARSSELSDVTVTLSRKCRLNCAPNWEKLNIVGLVGVEIADAVENGQKLYTTTATFVTDEPEAVAPGRLVFMLTSANSQRWIIGTGKRPYPKAKTVRNFPDTPVGTTLSKVTITWKSVCPLLEVID